MSTHSALDGGILVVTLDAPPVNSLGLELRQGLLAAIERAQADAQVDAVVLIGANGMFCGGADLRALDTPVYWTYPRTIELGTVLDAVSKPVVAAIGGLALGGGLELAMACHWRVAAPDARLALPEVTLGLLPGGGGTIRLPRLVGVETATAMMLSGEFIDARRAREIGLVDVLADGDLLQQALAFTRSLLARPDRLRRTSALPVRLAEPRAWFAEQRRVLEQAGVQGPAARTILQCLEAGVTLPVEEAVKVSDAGTRAVMESAESKALRYLFFAERLAGKTSEVAGARRKPIERVALFGAGPQASALEAMLRGAGVAISATAPQLVIVTPLAAADEAQLVSLHQSLAAGVAFATTGAFDDWQRLRAMLTARTVLGLRFSAGRAVELVRERDADVAAVDAVTRLLRRLGKVSVPCAPAPGFIIERLEAALELERQALLAEGHGRQEIDGALCQFGFDTGAADPATVPRDDLVGRCVGAMAAEGQELLDAGIAVRASDIDVALVAGGAFPAIRGGPMFSAAQGREPAA